MVSRRILLDIEVQRDFFSPAGSCYTRDASFVASGIYDLFAWARASKITVLSTLLRLRKGKISPLAAKEHCIEGTDGEKKLVKTVLSRRINLGLRNITDLPTDLLDEYQQVIFEKRHTDILVHARAERLITQLPRCTFVLCGAGVAWGIAQAAIGLRSRGFSVIVASDAVLDIGDPLAEMALLRMQAKGVIFLPTCEIVSAGLFARRQRRRVGSLLRGRVITRHKAV